ncbi:MULTISPECIES: hypothetical protein [unclassified Frankia]|uniref:hypothetical protein n=1 Tax=unclassified Frankia TaxID=2632575 RepID=UPI0040445468
MTLRAPRPDQGDSARPGAGGPDGAGPDGGGPDGGGLEGCGLEGCGPEGCGPGGAGPGGAGLEEGGLDETSPVRDDRGEERADAGGRGADAPAQGSLGRDGPYQDDPGQRGPGRDAAGHQAGPERGSTPTPGPGSPSATSGAVGQADGFFSTGRILAGSVLLGVLIALADLASAWVIVALPLTAITMVAYNNAIKKMLAVDDARIRPAENEPPTPETSPY